MNLKIYIKCYYYIIESDIYVIMYYLAVDILDYLLPVFSSRIQGVKICNLHMNGNKKLIVSINLIKNYEILIY